MMKKWMMVLTAFAAVMLIAPSAFAQDSAGAAARQGLLAIAAGFGMALAAFGGALGQGRIASAACEGMARNPEPQRPSAGHILGWCSSRPCALHLVIIS